MTEKQLIDDAVLCDLNAQAAEDIAAEPLRWQQADDYLALKAGGRSARWIAKSVKKDRRWVDRLLILGGEHAPRKNFWKRLRQLEAVKTVEARPLPNPPDGKYRTLVVDPPWEIEKIVREVRPNQVDMDYATMGLDQILSLEVPDWADEHAHLYLWTTHKHLPDALEIAAQWGFHYQCLLTWVKNVGITPFSWMYSTELVLFCRRGSLELMQLGRRLDFQADVRQHSRKPDEFYNLVRDVSPGPRLDVFSREERMGFDSWGNEAGKFTVAEGQGVGGSV